MAAAARRSLIRLSTQEPMLFAGARSGSGTRSPIPIPGPSVPTMFTRMVLGRHRMTVPVRRMFSEFSPPQEIRPIAPCVQVWLSPAQSTMPGWLNPVSGPTTCMMP